MKPTKEEMEIALKVYKLYLNMINNIGYQVISFDEFLEQQLSKIS